MTVTERKLAGGARSADEVMEDYRQYRSRLNPVLAPLLVPDPEDIYRWRVQYDCGCIEEQLATNDNVEWLLAHSHTDPISLMEVSMYGFPDGHVTDYEKAVDAPLTILAWVEAGFGLLFLALAFTPIGTLIGFVLVAMVAQVGVPWYFGTHLGLDNGIGG
jgi:hypothetical protein